MPCASFQRRRSSRIFDLVGESRAASGSSSRSTHGSVTKARASATRWRSPPEISPGRRWRRSAMRNSCSIAAARSQRTERGKCARPYSVFCSTVRCGNSARSCRTYPTARLATAVLTCRPESNKTRLPTAILPASGATRPAMQSRMVVFPDPEEPNSMVNPGAASNSTSSVNEGSAGVGIEVRLFDRADRPGFTIRRAIQPVDHRQHEETEDQQKQRRRIGCGVVGRLHLIININRDGARYSRNIASNHQHHSKLAHGVSKYQGRARDQSGHGKRQYHLGKSAEWRGSQRGRGCQQFAIDGGERSCERLNRERQAVDYGADHESGEGERQSVSGQRLPPAPQRAAGTEGDEHVKAEHGWRQHNGQGDQCFYQKLPASAREGDPVGQRQAEHKKYDRHNHRQFYGEPECLPIDDHFYRQFPTSGLLSGRCLGRAS